MTQEQPLRKIIDNDKLAEMQNLPFGKHCFKSLFFPRRLGDWLMITLFLVIFIYTLLYQVFLITIESKILWHIGMGRFIYDFLMALLVGLSVYLMTTTIPRRRNILLAKKTAFNLCKQIISGYYTYFRFLEDSLSMKFNLGYYPPGAGQPQEITQTFLEKLKDPEKLRNFNKLIIELQQNTSHYTLWIQQIITQFPKEQEYRFSEKIINSELYVIANHIKGNMDWNHYENLAFLEQFHAYVQNFEKLVFVNSRNSIHYKESEFCPIYLPENYDQI